MKKMPSPNIGDQKFGNHSGEFISTHQMHNMVSEYLVTTGRIDNRGIVQPLEILREGEPDRWLSGGPKLPSRFCSDIFFPTPDMRRPHVATNSDGTKSRDYVRIMDVLYSMLAGIEKIQLSTAETQFVQYSIDALDATIQGSKYEGFISGDQIWEAFHIRNTHTQPPEFAPTRVYVNGGIQGAQIAQRMIIDGADFSKAKVWVPYAEPGVQDFRKDTPIFEAQTYSQLRSLISHLRRLADQGLLTGNTDMESFVGVPIVGIPGAYVGQAKRGQSFNSNMDALFKGALEQVCSEQHHIRAGDKLTDNDIAIISSRMAELAIIKASKIGISTTNHAFYEGEPIQKILQIVCEN